MAAVILDGKPLAAKIKEQVRREVETMEKKPGLAVVMVGDNTASMVYLKGRKRDCDQRGIYSEEYILPAETTQAELMELIAELNARKDIDGILFQMPMPDHINARAVLSAVRHDKDVDCFHPYNMGQLMLGEKAFRPCTPAGIMVLLREYGIDPAGKTCVIVGRSNIVGKPLAMMMVNHDATVTICHTVTHDLEKKCRRADILVAAAGQRGLITGDMVKEGAVVIDIAINKDENGNLCGDVIYDEVAPKASYITPVPGGVGLVTRAMLMKNTLTAAKYHAMGAPAP